MTSPRSRFKRALAVYASFFIGISVVFELNAVFRRQHVKSSLSALKAVVDGNRLRKETLVPSKKVDSDRPASDWVVNTFVGSGLIEVQSMFYKDSRGDRARFTTLRGLNFAPDGWLYFADELDRWIKKINPRTRYIEHVAGYGWDWQAPEMTKGFIDSYKDGRASSAKFCQPVQVKIDHRGNIFVTDKRNHAVRRISPNGIVDSLCGPNTNPYSEVLEDLLGIKYEDIHTNLYRKQYDYDRASDTEDLMEEKPIALRKVPELHRRYFEPPLLLPEALAVDRRGHVYVGDTLRGKIKKIAPNKHITEVAGCGRIGYQDGPADEAKLGKIRDMAIDFVGNIFFVDPIYGDRGDNHYVRRVTPWGRVETIAGVGDYGHRDGAFSVAKFACPVGIDIDKFGNIIVLELYGSQVRKLTPNGEVTTIAGSGGKYGTQGWRDGTATASYFRLPHALTCDRNGEIWISDTQNACIRHLSYSPDEAEISKMSLDAEKKRKGVPLPTPRPTVKPTVFPTHIRRQMPANKIVRVLDSLKKAYFPKVFEDFELGEGREKTREIVEKDEENALRFLESLPDYLLQPNAEPMRHPQMPWKCSQCSAHNNPGSEFCESCYVNPKPMTLKEVSSKLRRVGISNLTQVLPAAILNGSVSLPGEVSKGKRFGMSASRYDREAAARAREKARAEMLKGVDGMDNDINAKLIDDMITLPTKSEREKLMREEDAKKRTTDVNKGLSDQTGGNAAMAFPKTKSRRKKEVDKEMGDEEIAETIRIIKRDYASNIDNPDPNLPKGKLEDIYNLDDDEIGPMIPQKVYTVEILSKPLGIIVRPNSLKVAAVSSKAKRLGIEVNHTIISVAGGFTTPWTWKKLFSETPCPFSVILRGPDPTRKNDKLPPRFGPWGDYPDGENVTRYLDTIKKLVGRLGLKDIDSNMPVNCTDLLKANHPDSKIELLFSGDQELGMEFRNGTVLSTTLTGEAHRFGVGPGWEIIRINRDWVPLNLTAPEDKDNFIHRKLTMARLFADYEMTFLVPSRPIKEELAQAMSVVQKFATLEEGVINHLGPRIPDGRKHEHLSDAIYKHMGLLSSEEVEQSIGQKLHLFPISLEDPDPDLTYQRIGATVRRKPFGMLIKAGKLLKKPKADKKAIQRIDDRVEHLSMYKHPPAVVTAVIGEAVYAGVKNGDQLVGVDGWQVNASTWREVFSESNTPFEIILRRVVRLGDTSEEERQFNSQEKARDTRSGKCHCDKCGEQFPTRSKLHTHQRTCKGAAANILEDERKNREFMEAMLAMNDTGIVDEAERYNMEDIGVIPGVDNIEIAKAQYKQAVLKRKAERAEKKKSQKKSEKKSERREKRMSERDSADYMELVKDNSEGLVRAEKARRELVRFGTCTDRELIEKAEKKVNTTLRRLKRHMAQAIIAIQKEIADMEKKGSILKDAREVSELAILDMVEAKITASEPSNLTQALEQVTQNREKIMSGVRRRKEARRAQAKQFNNWLSYLEIKSERLKKKLYCDPGDNRLDYQPGDLEKDVI
ncbi:hypothetical protein AAMO2058_000255400 [Amorphochlora amoebiformis]